MQDERLAEVMVPYFFLFIIVVIAVQSAATNLSQDLGLSILDHCTSVGVAYVMNLCKVANEKWSTGLFLL